MNFGRALSHTMPAHSKRAPTPAPTARSIAALVVERVLKDAAYLSRALDAELQRHPQLEARERALAAELSYGSIRCHGMLVAELSRHAKKRLPNSDPELLSWLLIAAYQVLLLDRVPESAAVNAAVSAVRRRRGTKVAGFANALLRNLCREQREVSRESAVNESVPQWLRARLARDYGEAELSTLVGALGEPAPLTARRVGSEALPTEWASLKPCRFAPRAFELPTGLPTIERGSGGWVVQEEGAQLIGWALGARPGERILDACAGRGAKTSLVWEAMQQTGVLWAADVHPHKLDTLRREFERLGLAEPRVCSVDWTLGQGEVPAGFDRVLVDAPCTGTGTLRRRPELMLRLRPEDPARMARLQEAIVRSAATRLAPGGRFVYAVCSVLREEGEAVVASVSDILEPVPFDSPVIERVQSGHPTTLRLLPWAHGTDGYFLASLRLK